jgi:uncharacterized membrane protein (DUF4010 family)
VVGLAAVIAALVTGNFVAVRNGKGGSGQTTELAMLVMYLVGAYAASARSRWSSRWAPAWPVLLHLKPALRSGRPAGRRRFRAIMSFVGREPGRAASPAGSDLWPVRRAESARVWLMVVLIVGIGLAGYLGYKLFGARGGSLPVGCSAD